VIDKGLPEIFSKSRSAWWKVHENELRKREAEDFSAHIAMSRLAPLVFVGCEDANHSSKLLSSPLCCALTWLLKCLNEKLDECVAIVDDFVDEYRRVAHLTAP
jgi:hypothetical protein